MDDNTEGVKTIGFLPAEVDERVVIDLLRVHFGLNVDQLRQLDGYDDKNYFFNVIDEKESKKGEFIFKITNSGESANLSFIEGQNAVLRHVAARCNDIVRCPNLLPSLDGTFFKGVYLPRADGSTSWHVLRVLTYLPGKLLKDECSVAILEELGYKVAIVDKALGSFYHPVFDSYRTVWHMQAARTILRNIDAVPSDATIHGINKRQLVEKVIQHFEETVPHNYPHMTAGHIHGDINEGNIVINQRNGTSNIDGFLDFGDTSLGFLAFEVGIAISYMMLECFQTIPIVNVGGHFLKGYSSVLELNDYDWQAIIPTVLARIAVSLVRGAYAYQMMPTNKYLLNSEKNGWEVLYSLWNKDFHQIHDTWKNMIKS